MCERRGALVLAKKRITPGLSVDTGFRAMCSKKCRDKLPKAVPQSKGSVPYHGFIDGLSMACASGIV